MSWSPALLVAASGLGLGLSLIVAIGAQNAFVLRQGIRREHVLPVVLICAASDMTLIAAGVGGAGAVLRRLPSLLTAIRFVGAAFLLGYAVLAARRALRPVSLDPTGGPVAGSNLGATIATCLALTWLNPHVYLDTVVLLGSIANSHGAHRWSFAAGAAVGSIAWFAALGFGARLLRPIFARPAAWRVLDLVIAAVMTAIAVVLAVGAGS